MAPGEWLYIASLLPEPYTSLEEEGLPAVQLWFIALSSIFLLLFIGLLVHWQVARSSVWPGRRGICRWGGQAQAGGNRWRQRSGGSRPGL